MSENLLYALGALATWLGCACSLLAMTRLFGFFVGTGSDRISQLKGLTGFGTVAAILLLVGSRFATAGQGSTGGVWVPLVWLVMPFAAWVAVCCGGMAVLRGGQAYGELIGERRAGLWRSACIWSAAAIGFTAWDARFSEPIKILKGGIALQWTTATALLLILVASVAAMRLAANHSVARRWSRTAVIQLLLVTGSVVFGLPFAFLIITSFKEDRDMSSPNGIVWIPRVQQTVPYWDKQDPLMQGRYQGRTVDGSIVEAGAHGTVRLEINDPASMRGLSFTTDRSSLKQIPRQIPLVTASFDGRPIQGEVVENLLDGRKRVIVTQPASLAGRERLYNPNDVEPVRAIGLNWKNYPDALDYMPPETLDGLMYLKNTLIIVVLSVVGTVLSSSIVAYAFARMKFPGRDMLFAVLLATMMLPGAVTLLPRFLIFRALGWVDTLYPIWVPAFFASAFNVFMLRQFFKSVPVELEDAARIDGCTPARTFWSVMLPLVKPALAVIAIWAFMGAWNNFMEPLIYISSPEKMPLSYALQLFQGDRSNEPGLLMAFATMTMLPVLLLFFFAQKYFIEGVTLSGFGGR